MTHVWQILSIYWNILHMYECLLYIYARMYDTFISLAMTLAKSKDIIEIAETTITKKYLLFSYQYYIYKEYIMSRIKKYICILWIKWIFYIKTWPKNILLRNKASKIIFNKKSWIKNSSLLTTMFGILYFLFIFISCQKISQEDIIKYFR